MAPGGKLSGHFVGQHTAELPRKTRAALAAVPILLISWPGTPLVIAPWAMANGQCHSICYSISVLLSCDMNASDRLTPAAG